MREREWERGRER